jgi:adenine-specific DNA-methyltransferase
VWEDKNAIFLDSFAGSGTTGHAVLQLNKEDGGNRRFILVEMEREICQKVTAERLRRVIAGYGDREGLGGGFRYCTLEETLFDAAGQIRESVGFGDLARHIFFTETGGSLRELPDSSSPLIGCANGTAYYLLRKGANSSGALDAAALRALPPFDGVKVVYAEECRASAGRLQAANVIFRQVPYAVRVT